MLSSDTGVSVADRMRSARITPYPWPHAYVPATLDAASARRFSRSFARFALTDCEQVAREKTYRFATADLTAAAAVAAGPEWAALAAELTGPDYPAAMSELTGTDLSGATLSLALWEYRGGDWLAPHVDKPDKVVTQIFYFTESWSETDLGRLLILETPDVSSPVRALPPVLGSSAVLVRSETSWHAVEPLAAGAVAPRRSLTATFRR